jgi:hypothetical protein
LILVVGLVGGTAPVRWVPLIKNMTRWEKWLCEVLGVALLVGGGWVIYTGVVSPTRGSNVQAAGTSGDAAGGSPTPAPAPTDPATPAPSPSDTSTPTDAPTPDPPTVSAPPAQVTLTNLDPIAGGGNISQEAVRIQGVDYGTADVLVCYAGEHDDTWDVSGYKKMTVTLGIPSADSPSEVGAEVKVLFTSNGTPLVPTATSSIGHVVTITVPLTGVDQLTIGCTDVHGPSGGGASNIRVALAGATVLS